MANAHGNDGTGNRVEKRKGDVGRIAVSIWPAVWNFIVKQWQIFVSIALALVVVGSAHVLLGPMSGSSESPAIAALNWMQQLPTKLAFYYLLAVLTGAYLGWRWWLSANIRKEIETKEEDEDRSSLSPRDWWVIREIRRRAIIFRTWASLLLVGVIALLFGGIYLVLFVLPQIGGSDRLLVQQQRQQAIFKERFSRRLQLISEGRYWFKVDDVNLRDDPNSEEDIFSDLLKMINVQSANMTPPVGMTRSRLPVLNAHEITKKKSIILVVGHGQTLVTQDGGQTWEVPGGLELKEGEWIVAATFGADGYGLVAGTEGSVFVTKDGGQTWEIPGGLELKEGEGIVAAAFGADDYGLVAGDEGSVFVTKDGGKTWEVLGVLELKEGEWIVAAAFGADDYGLVAGDEGSVFVTKDGGQTWDVPEDLKLKEAEWIVAAALGADDYGLVAGTKEGSVNYISICTRLCSTPFDATQS